MPLSDLREVDRLEITVLVDNYTDLLLLLSTDVVKRPTHMRFPDVPLAEHGLSCLLKIYAGQEEHVLLMDAGVTSYCLFHNASVLNASLDSVESVILSHGDFDHIGGLPDFLKQVKKEMEVFAHPDAFLERRLNITPLGMLADLPTLKEALIRKNKVVIQKRREPSLLASDLVLLSGEIARTTDFEKGFPWAEVKVDDKWVVNPFNDDQGIAVNIKGRGLVILSGCAHAGIINTVRHLQKISGTDKVHAVLGGFHLSGPIFEPSIGPTIAQMKEIGVDYVVPMHCTGFKASTQFASLMPEQYLLNSVGTTYVFA